MLGGCSDACWEAFGRRLAVEPTNLVEKLEVGFPEGIPHSPGSDGILFRNRSWIEIGVVLG